MKAVFALIIVSVLTIALGLWWLNTQPLAPQEPEAVVPDNAEPVYGSEDWCEAMVALPGEQWTDADTRTFAERCLLD
jgi:hypothetical protein